MAECQLIQDREIEPGASGFPPRQRGFDLLGTQRTPAEENGQVGQRENGAAFGAGLVERARVLRLSGIRDSLTKLANRSYFMEKIEEAGARLRRRGEPFTVFMLPSGCLSPR